MSVYHSHVCIIHIFILFVFSHFAHIYTFQNSLRHSNMCTSFECLHYSHAYIIHMFTLFTCLHHSHVYIIHMFTLFTCLHYLHIYIIHMFILITHLDYSHVYSNHK